MQHYVGIDVSLELSSLCVLDVTGKVIREAKVASEPEALVTFLRGVDVVIERIGWKRVRTGPLCRSPLSQPGRGDVLVVGNVISSRPVSLGAHGTRWLAHLGFDVFAGDVRQERLITIGFQMRRPRCHVQALRVADRSWNDFRTAWRIFASVVRTGLVVAGWMRLTASDLVGWLREWPRWVAESAMSMSTIKHTGPAVRRSPVAVSSPALSWTRPHASS